MKVTVSQKATSTEETGRSDSFVGGRRIHRPTERVGLTPSASSRGSVSQAYTPPQGPCTGRVIPPSEVSRVPRDSGREGELRVGAASGEGFPDHWSCLFMGRLPCRTHHDLGIVSAVTGFSNGPTGHPGCKQKAALTDAGSAQRIPSRRLSPDCNITGSLTVSLFLHGYRDEEGR